MNNRTQEEITLSPVVGWQVGPIQAYEAVMLRLDFLSHALQRADEAHPSPNFVLTAAQALELSETLKKHAGVATQGTPGNGVPKH